MPPLKNIPNPIDRRGGTLGPKNNRLSCLTGTASRTSAGFAGVSCGSWREVQGKGNRTVKPPAAGERENRDGREIGLFGRGGGLGKVRDGHPNRRRAMPAQPADQNGKRAAPHIARETGGIRGQTERDGITAKPRKPDARACRPGGAGVEEKSRRQMSTLREPFAAEAGMEKKWSYTSSASKILRESEKTTCGDPRAGTAVNPRRQAADGHKGCDKETREAMAAAHDLIEWCEGGGRRKPTVWGLGGSPYAGARGKTEPVAKRWRRTRFVGNCRGWGGCERKKRIFDRSRRMPTSRPRKKHGQHEDRANRKTTNRRRPGEKGEGKIPARKDGIAKNAQ